MHNRVWHVNIFSVQVVDFTVSGSHVSPGWSTLSRRLPSRFSLKIYAIVAVNKTWEKEMTDTSSAAFMEMQIVAKMIVSYSNL